MIRCHGELAFVCYNKIKDLTVEWPECVCHDVVIEPLCSHSQDRLLFLLLLTSKILPELMHMPMVLGSLAKYLFDVRVLLWHMKLLQLEWLCYIQASLDDEEKAVWWQSSRSRLASFAPLVFSTTEGMGRERTAFYHWLADRKHDWVYSTTILWVRCILTEICDYLYKRQQIHFVQVLFYFSWDGPDHESTWCVKSIMYHECWINFLICWSWVMTLFCHDRINLTIWYIKKILADFVISTQQEHGAWQYL